MDLHSVVEAGKKAAVKKLIVEGHVVDERAALDETSLHVAAKKGKHGIAELLLEHGADVNAENYKRDTPLHHAALDAFVNVVVLLLEHGANAALIDTYEDTPLHKCAGGPGLSMVKARAEIAEKLIAAGCDVNATNYSGRTALWHAASRGNEPLVRVLLAHGADPTIKAKGQQGSAISAAVRKDHSKIVALLEDAVD